MFVFLLPSINDYFLKNGLSTMLCLHLCDDNLHHVIRHDDVLRHSNSSYTAIMCYNVLLV